ncbi:unnamed protein product [Rotaria sp. Silwood2]|nr:unnamed protein product [Rotaria sp. Silwood2]CAF4473245.1 unnamed protein product [Rotaria sp. Silwood2]
MLIEQVDGNNGPREWWHHRWFTIICICFLVVAILAVILTSVLKFIILAPKKQDIIMATIRSSTGTSPSPTTTLPSSTTPLTTFATTVQQSANG